MIYDSILSQLNLRRKYLGFPSGNYEWVFHDQVMVFAAPSLHFLSQADMLEVDHKSMELSRKYYYSNEARWMLGNTALGLVLKTFRANNVDVIILKAFASAGKLYPVLGLRSFSDIDLVVKPSNFLAAILLLLGIKFVLLKENFENLKLSPDKVTEVALKSPSGVIVEIHQSILPVKNFFRYEKAYDIDENKIWEQAIDLKIGEQSASTLNLLDTLAHLCLHAATHGLSTQAPFTYLDIDNWIKKEIDHINWESFITTAKEWKIRSAAYHTFLLCKQLYNTPISEDVINKLDPGFWAKWRVSQVYSVESYLANDKKKIGIKHPKFVRFMLFDKFSDLIKILIRGFLPTNKERIIVYGTQTSIWKHWSFIVKKYGIEF